MRVRLHASWCDDVEVREAFNRSTPNGDYIWKDMELVLGDDYDWLVAFNHPTHDAFDPARTVIFQSEPRIHRRRIEHEHATRLRGCRVVDTDRHFNLDKWYIHRSYQQLEEPIRKSRTLSTIVSGMTWLPRHRQRLAFALDVLPSVTADFDHFGRNLPSSAHVRGEIADKAEALLPYRYTFNAENSVEINYFTEKILDPILCECLCFYDGCPNLEAFLDPEAFIPISMDQPDEAREIMREAIARDEWGRRLPAIRAQKRRLMEELNPLELIRKVLEGEPVVWRTDDELDATPPQLEQRRLPPVFVVSLADASERRKRIGRHLGRLGIPFAFFDGIRGADLRPEERERLVAGGRARRRLGRSLTSGEIGCALSHLEVMRLVADGDAGSVVVLEDDARLTSDAAALIEGVAAHVRPGDLVLLGSIGGGQLRVGDRVRVTPSAAIVTAARGGIWGTHAYLVTRDAARAFVRHFARVESLADDWSHYGGVVNLRLLDPQCAWSRGPLGESSAIEAERTGAEDGRATVMQHSLIGRLSYKARLIDAVHPRIGGRLVKLVDAFEFAGVELRRIRFTVASLASGRRLPRLRPAR